MTGTVTPGESPLPACDGQTTDKTEAMLIHKIALLEEHIRYYGHPRPLLEERCQALRKKVLSLEAEISKAGTSSAAMEYLQSAPESHFKQVTRHEFLSWLNRDVSTSPSSYNNLLGVEFSKKRLSPGPSDGHDMDSMLSRNSSPATPNGRSKRLRTQGEEGSPCLRCKILKKKCDSLEQCNHCPTQSYDSEVDFWKVLGCLRGYLSNLSEIFCPAFSRSCQRTLVYRSGGTDIINFVLTKSRVSDQKRRRMLNLVRTRYDFSRLDDISWDDSLRRESLAMSGSSSVQDEERGDGLMIALEDYEAAWSALQVVSMDRVYLSKTAYNLFTLLRLGNSFSRSDQTTWELFKLSKRLLRQSTEIYLLERLCAQIASGNLAGEAPFDPTRSTPNTLVLVDLKEDMENFLSIFEKMCASRAKLKDTAQIACFYALLCFGVAKSILTDAYSIRTSYEEPNPWSDEIYTKISSGYKVLVSVYCWASKTDLLLQDEPYIISKEAYDQLLHTQEMVQTRRWDTLGIKSTKDYLLGLGMCSLHDGSYNGFFVQKFGLEKLPKISREITRVVKVPKSSGDLSRLLETSQASMTVASPNEEPSPASTSTFAGTSGPSPFWDSRRSSITPVTPGHITSPASTSSSSQIYGRLETIKSDGPAASSPTAFTFVSHDTSGVHDIVRTHGGRKGALQPATLQKSREVRRVGACWNCWVMKMPCSEGPVCQRCEKRGTELHPRCNRAPFTAYMDVLFPEWIVSDFSPQAISAYINTNTRGFTSQTVVVETVSWTGDMSMSHTVNYFNPLPDGATQETYLDKDGNPLGVESLPVALLEVDVAWNTPAVHKIIDQVIQNPQFPVYVVGHNTSELASTVFKVLFDYYNAMADKDKFIYDCFALIVLVHTLHVPIMFKPSSVPSILSHLRIEHRPEQLYSSRIFDRQAKATGFSFGTLMATKVLTQLEKIIRSRDRLFWPRCFAAMILLAYSMEQMEVFAGAHVQAKKTRTSDSGATLGREPEEYCETVDRGPYTQLLYLFHALYRTSKADQGGLNPLNGDFAGKDDAGFDDVEMKMIRDIREKVMSNVDLLNERNKPLDFNAGQEELAKSNSGRLIAKFLLSFL